MAFNNIAIAHDYARLHANMRISFNARLPRAYTRGSLLLHNQCVLTSRKRLPVGSIPLAHGFFDVRTVTCHETAVRLTDFDFRAASLFDFVEPWKIDILDYLNENYMFDLSLSEIAGYTGRSLATFKRDFAKVSDLTPQKWIIRRRLAAAHDLIKSGHHRITDVCYEVGFKNLAHFSRAYKEVYGVPPSAK